MDRLLLSGGSPLAGDVPDDGRMAGAVAVHAETQAQRTVFLAGKTELAEVAIQMLELPLTELRTKLNKRCVGNERLPVVQNAYVSDVSETPVMPNRPMIGMLRQALQNSHGGSKMDECLFSCTCGPSLRTFEIVVLVGYAFDNLKDALPFRLLMWCRNAGGKQPFWPEDLMDLCNDGTFRKTATREVLTSDQVVDLAYRWMTEQRFWKAIG